MNIKTIGFQAFTITVLMTVTHTAFALSCMRPDPVEQCRQLQTAGMPPVFANGQLRLKKIISQEKKEMNIGGKGPSVAEYLFTGKINDSTGEQDVKNANILISTSCAGPWCAKLPEDNKSGAFLLKADAKSGLTLHLGPCSFQPFTLTPEQAEEIKACVTPEPVKKPEVTQNIGSSQVYTQRNKDKNLVK